ncbi:MAG: FAD-dependent oxidoreductase [Burkholderiaceae bacterium]|jgi:glycine oxidase|nr:FAD-dependent oxidoreductase [Burkholderiaceae bacterium]
MTTIPMNIGIAGAGLLGRLLAWRLARQGHRVAVFDPAAGPGQVLRSCAPEPYLPTAAAFTAAGLLSPLAELDNAAPAVAALGWRSLALWPGIIGQLPHAPFFAARGSLLVAHRADTGAAQRVLDRLRAATATPEWRAVSPAEGVQPLDAGALKALEPAVQGPPHAWFLPGEGQIDTGAAMMGLHSAAQGVQWHWRQTVLAVEAGERGGTLALADGRLLPFDAVIDVRGVGARPAIDLRGENQKKHASPVFNVRGVRGEVIKLHVPGGHGLTRPVRLLHPRHAVYIVPRPDDLMYIGASEIESEDRSPASLRSVIELLAAAHSAVPALAEARILALDVNLRPALPDNDPCTEHAPRLLRINGLYRHGWLLAPALIDQALRENGWVEGGLG